MARLKDKWWVQRGGGQCEKNKESDKSGSSPELGMENVGGVFLVLGIGCAVSLLIAICEFLWNVRKVAVKEKVHTHTHAYIKNFVFQERVLLLFCLRSVSSAFRY